MDDKMREQLERLAAQHAEDSRVAAEIVDADPTIPYITALIMAGDRRTMKSADDAVNEGIPAMQASIRVGSYYRLEWCVSAYERGVLDYAELLDNLPELWRGSDPNDTDPKYLRLWEDAWKRNGRKYVRDGRALPQGQTLTLFRGQDEVPASESLSELRKHFGIAWTTDPKIAEKFAHGAATRQSNRGGIVYRARVPRSRVYAYLTSRGESEVIVDPKYLMVP